MQSSILQTCPGCGVELPDKGHTSNYPFYASPECRYLFEQLSFYTLAHPSPEFFHQHVVDAYEAQHMGPETKSITVVFGLIGLYLALEKEYRGKQVQLTHIRLGRFKKQWPRFMPPVKQGTLTIRNVMAAAPGKERDGMIIKWCQAVWDSWGHVHVQIRELAQL